MTYPIKSTLCFAYLGLVAGALLLGGCFDAPSKRSGSERGAAESTDTSYRGPADDIAAALNTVTLSPGDDVSLNAPALESPVETVKNAEQNASSARKTSLPKSINWDMPAEKTAVAEEKIAADNAGSAVQKPQAVPEQTTESTEVEIADQSNSKNPFALIDESMENALPLTPTEEAIGEDVWEQGQAANHDSLEHLEIKNQAAEHGAMQPDVPGGGKIVPDTVPDVIRNEPGLKPGAKKPADAPANDSQTTESKDPYNFGDNAWEAAEPESKAATSDERDVPAFDPNRVSTLPNVQNDDSDPFGIDAANAADQFGQTFGGDAAESDSVTTPTTAPVTTPESATPQEEPGLGGDDFWNDGGFDAGFGETQTPQTPQQPAKPAAQPGTQGSAKAGAATQGSKTQTPGADATTAIKPDDLSVTEPLTPVEEYLVNEAGMSSVKLMESVELLYKLNKPRVVRRLLRQLTERDLTAEECRQISKRVNAAVMAHISLDAEYQPEGGHAMRKIVEGSKSYFESRTNVENAMKSLLSGTDREKDDARRTILNGGETSIEYLLERLATSNDQKELSEVMSLLNATGESARRALQESLVTSTPLGMRAARLLTQMGRASDARFLLPMLFDANLTDMERREVAGMVQTLTKNVPTPDNAAATLYTMATNYFRGKVPFMTDADNNVSLWVLGEGSQVPKFVTMTEAEASRHFAEKFARYAACLDPKKAAYRQLWLVAYFDLKGAELTSDESILQIDAKLLQTMLTGLSVDDVESALRMALQQDHAIAARVAAELLGEFGDVDEVLYKRGSQSALVKAVGFSDRRVRFAALQSIMKLNPDRPYPGSSVVSQSLVYFTRATGQKRAVVVCPWVGDATAIANLLTPLGYTSEVATMGRQAMQLAIDSADTELMMLDVRTPNSDVGFLVQDMRADNRTHDVPIAVLASGWRVSRAERATYGDNKLETSTSREVLSPQEEKNRIVTEDGEFIVSGEMMTKAERAAYGSKMAKAFPRPYDEAAAKFVVESLLNDTGVELVPPQIRLAEAKQSIEWVAQLYRQPNIYHFENIEQIAWDTLWQPELTAETLKLVELIPSATAQRMLTHIVSTAAFPLETRQAALKAFESNAQLHGVLIRGQQILDLYDMYNASGAEPIASQQARGDLLDVVEKYANYMQNVGYTK